MNPFLIGLIGIGIYLMTKSMSESGRDLIKRLEGYSPFIYDDSAGIPTIGWGHKLLPGENIKFQHGINQATAEDLLTQDMQFAVNAVNYYVTVPLTQNQFNALVSFVFNIGASAFADSTLLKELNNKNYNAVDDQLKRWKYVTINGVKKISQGLVKRRENEINLFYS